MDKNVETQMKTQDVKGEVVSYLAFESACSRLERSIKRMFILCIILIIALIASNICWVVYEMQYQDVEVTQEVDQEADEEGENTFVGGDYSMNEEE